MRLRRASNLSALVLAFLVAGAIVACTSKYTDDDFGAARIDGTGGTPGTGGSGMGGDGMGGGTPDPPDHGLVVLAGVDQENVGVLSSLDPTTGAELSRETLPSGVRVAAIAHDGAPGRDLWFVFTAGTFPANPSVPANLQVRSFDDASETWTTLGTVTNLPPPLPGTLAVLNERLAYVSFVVEGGEVVQTVTLLDTSDPENVTQIAFEFPTSGESDGEALVGLVGVRGTEEDASLPGGTLNVTISGGAVIVDGRPLCEGACDVEIQSIAVGSLIQAGLRGVLGQETGTPAIGASAVPQVAVDPTQRDVLVAVPGATPSNDVHLYRIPDPRDPTAAEFDTLPLVAESVGGFAFAECARVLAFSLPTSTLDGVTRTGIKRTVELNRPGQLLGYEPYTRGLIAPFNPEEPPVDEQSPEIAAFEVATNSSGTSITIEPRSDWSPPDDLRVDVLAVRSQASSSCD